ncbi:MAG: glycosyltransferase family 4 protein, partial [Halobacteriaceae archaeon]
MKVLTVSSAKFGVKNVVYNLLSHLTEQDVSCTYLTLPIHEVPENCDEEFLLSESLLHTLERFRPLYLGYGIFNFWRCAYRYMATNGTEFDVIWLHNPRLLPLLPESIENRLLITYHSHLMHRKSDHHSFPTSLYYRLIGQVEKRGLAKTSGVRFTVVYEPVLEELRDLDINPDRITYIGNGVDLNMFHPNTENQSLRHQWDLPASQILLFLGRLVEEKRPLGLLETFNQLSDLLNNELSLVIAGNGPLESKAHKFVSQNDLQNVRFLGYVDHEKTPSL